VRLRRGHAEAAFGLDGVARPQDLTAVEVDLATPGLRFVTNPPSSGPAPGPARPGHQVHTRGGALTDLVAARPEVLVAVNANFFWPCCARRGSDPAPVGMTVFGLAVDGGTVVSGPAAPQGAGACAPVPAVPDPGAVGAPALLIDRANRVSLATVTAADPVPADIQAAVAGGPQPDGRTPPPCGEHDGYPPGRPVPGPAFLLRDGRTTATPAAAPPELVAGRTFVGLTGARAAGSGPADARAAGSGPDARAAGSGPDARAAGSGDGSGRRLVLATIDGSDTGGAAFFDEASWLLLLGATEGLNLDGGGSSAMVLNAAGLARVPVAPCPADGPVRLLDVPDNGGRCRERLVGTYLGVVAPRA
jgi:hypothetical protein